MVLAVGESFITAILVTDENNNPASGKTISYRIFDQAMNLEDSGNMSELGSYGIYYKAWTPNVEGYWFFEAYYSGSDFHFYDLTIYQVGKGVEDDILDLLGTPNYSTIVGDISNLITRSKGLDEIHDDLATHDTDIKALLAGGFPSPSAIWSYATRTLTDPDSYKADVSNLALEATLSTHDTDIKALLATVQADLDSPNQYKADVTALALEATLATHDADIKALLSTIQTDLDSPDQYKADVSALALETTLTTIMGGGWSSETLKAIYDLISGVKAKTDNLPADPADESLLEAAIATAESNIRGVDSDTLKTLSDQLDGIVGGMGTATLEKQNQIMDGTIDLSGGWVAGTDNLHEIYALIAVIDGKVDTIDGVVDNILADTTVIDWSNVTDILTDTNELQTDWHDGGRLDLLIDAIKAKTDTINWGDITSIDGIVDDILADTATIDWSNVTDILADTNELQGDWTDGGRLDLLIDAIKAKTDTIVWSDITTIDGIVDDILADTATINWSNVTDILTDTNELQGDWTDGGRLDLLIDAIKAKTDTIVWTDIAAIENKIKASPSVDSILFKSGGAVCPAGKSIWDALGDGTVSLNDIFTAIGGGVTGTVSDAGPTATDFDTDLSETTNDHYNNLVIVFTSGVLSGQARRIKDYDGTSKNIIVHTAFTEAPADGDDFYIAVEEYSVDEIILDEIQSATYGLSVIEGLVDDLESRLTATRAGYLDELDFDLDARLGNPAGASISADIAAIKAVVDDILADTATIDWSDVTDILADTNELQTDWADGGRLDLLIDAIKAKTDTIDWTNITDILTDTNELQTDWTDGGRLDLLIDAIKAKTDTIDWTDITTIDGIVDDILADTATINWSNVTDILADTNELQTDWHDGGRLDLLIDAIKAKTDTIDWTDITTIDGIVDDILADTATINWTNVTDILADTNELQGDWVDGGRLDLLIDAIKAKTDTIVWGDITTIDGIVDDILMDTNELQTDWTDGGRLDLLIDAIKDKTDNLPADPADASDIAADFDRHVTWIDFWGDADDVIPITGGSTDIDLPDVVIPALPTGATIWKVVVLFKCAIIKDTSGSDNAINGAAAIRIKKSTGAWGVDDITAYDIKDNSWAVDVSEATERGGDAFVGNMNNDNLSGEVDGAATYELRFEDIQADGGNLELHDLAVGLRVYIY